MVKKLKKSCLRRRMTNTERDAAHKLKMRTKKLERIMRKVEPGFITWPSNLYKPNGERGRKRRRFQHFASAYKREGAVNITVLGGV